ncbi:MAG TPA: beta-ketoacyl synthase N-terminal-like domain-containing protein [Thermoanaerobaculia bacterium]|nr:beta-ketoacyl synthase N-terminal-like domain-containing protein [Thermoanaerobaculia bacterium]
MPPTPTGLPQVVISGLGYAGVHGYGRSCLEPALCGGEPPPTSEVDRPAGYHRRRGARRACLADPAGMGPWVAPAEARRMSPLSRLAVAAARMALEDAGLGSARGDGEAGRRGAAVPARGARGQGDWIGDGGDCRRDTAVVVATGFGPSSFSEALLRQILGDGPESASPYLFTESVANAPAAQIAIACGARGPSVTVCQRESGALLAVARGAAEVAAGRACRALVGVVDEISPLVHALLDRFGALARGVPTVGGEPDGSELARPFDRRRDGVVAADGAAMLVLERAADAVRRGARPLARVLAGGSAFDPTAPVTGWGAGHERLGAALRRTLDRAGLEASGVERIVSGGSGARGGDRLEAATLRAAWSGRPLPPVLVPKSVTGEYGGGFLAAAVLAAAGARFGPTAGFAEPDPALGLVPHDGRPLRAPATVLLSSLAAGGAAAWLVLAAP